MIGHDGDDDEDGGEQNDGEEDGNSDLGDYW